MRSQGMLTDGFLRFPAETVRRYVLATAIISLIVPAGAADADDYRIGIMDKLTIRVVEWQTAEGKFREWPTVSGDYIVGATGSLALPFAGDLKAAGQTPAELGSLISRNLQLRFALTDPPEASVEIAEYRPIFVSGEVRTPGKYPFDPEMTVLKAVSLAGGMRRGADEGQRFERDFISAKGSYDGLVVERTRLLAKKARLTAEEADAPAITPPDQMASNPQARAILDDEASIMETNKNTFDLKIKGLSELQDLYGNEITSLEKKVQMQNHQLDLYQKELDKTSRLVDQGLMLSSRVLSLETTLSDTQSNLLDLDAATLRAKQELNKAALDAVDLKNDRKSKIVLALNDTKSQLDQNSLQMQMYRSLMTEAVVNAPDVAREKSGDVDDQISFTIVRTQDGKVTELPATSTSLVQPGDLVKVSVAGQRS